MVSGANPSPTPLPAVARDWPEIGEVNMLEASLGQRGEGKSMGQCIRVWEQCREWGSAYVIGHSLGRRLPEALPRHIYGGARLPIVYHPTLRSLAKGLYARPEKWHILAPPSGAEARAANIDEASRDSADDLFRYADDLALMVRRQAWARAHPVRSSLLGVPRDAKFTGLKAPPVIVICDEGIAVQAAKADADKRASTKHDWFMEWLISLRHNHIALFYAIQNPTMRSWKVLEQATALHVYHLNHEWALNAIRAAGARPDQLSEIASLRRFEKVTIYPVRSEAPDAAKVPTAAPATGK